MSIRRNLVIVGNGMVGLRLVEELLHIAPQRFAITVIGAEPEPAYNRVLLSSFLGGDIGENDVHLRTRAWYERNGVHLITGEPAIALVPERRSIVLRNCAVVPYDICVLATGSNPIRLNVPGAEYAGVHVFRTLADARALQAAEARHPVVIGGGLLGIEAAYGLARRARPVTLVHLMDRLMERQIDAKAADLLRDVLARCGVTVLLGEQTVGFGGSDRVESVALRDGRALACDLAIVAVGVRPAAVLAADAGLAVRRGILVDDRLQTSAPDVFAIGECAEHRGVCYGLVEPGYEQASVLAHGLADQAATYGGSLAATHLKVSGIPVFSAGDFEGVDAETITLRDTAAGVYRKFVVRDGRLAGAVLFGDTHDALWYRDLIRGGTAVAPIRADLPFGKAYAEAA